MSRKFLTGIDVNSQRITSLADPSSNTDAANKQYVDNVARGLEWKSSVRVATTTSGTLASAYANGQTVDGITLATGNRILIKNQSTASENGIYVVAASGAPSRAADLASGVAAAGVAVTVEEGTANGDKVFICTSDAGSDVVGTNNLAFSALGGGTTYTADGNGIELSSTTFSLELDGTTLSKSSAGLRIGSGAAGNGLSEASGVLAVNAGTGLEISADNLRLAAASGTGLTGGAGSALAVDTSVVARYVEVSSAAAQTTVVTHNFGRAGVMVQVYDPTGFNIIEADVTNRTTNACTVDFGAAVTSGQYKIVVVG